jgi:hypothetical protein
VDELDFEEGFLMLPQTVPLPPSEAPAGIGPGVPPEVGRPEPVPPGAGPTPEKMTSVRISFRATREQLFNIWNALANLADAASSIHMTVEARNDDGFDPVWLRNAVQEPIDESGAEVDG